ncbi:MAG: hypothetical protein K9W42_06565 [Candidatus Heimdallarchaeota archaeon]|nr:hypothetical protein [Candidatus Heimdallarchaeota archaeon]
MKILYYRVGMDTGVGGCVGPIFKDKTFEYIPIPDYFTTESRTFSNTIGRSGKKIKNFVPKKIANCPMHLDPDYSANIPVCCEGTTQQNTFKKLKLGDYLIHYAGLSPTPLKPKNNIDLYFIGYMKVKEVIQVNLENVKKVPINAHTRRFLFIEKMIKNSIVRGFSQKVSWEEIVAKAKKIEQMPKNNREVYYSEKCEKELLKNPLIIKNLKKRGGRWTIQARQSCLTSRIKEITGPLQSFIEVLKEKAMNDGTEIRLSPKAFVTNCAYLLWCFTQFVVVIGSKESRLLDGAFKISKRSTDKKGNFLNRIKDDIAPLLGIKENTAIQRKNLRFIPNSSTLKGDPEKLLNMLR